MNDLLLSSEERGSGGFVLIGVVIMVLALTILGLSLFSLSSYEAQFLNRSVDEAQTFQYAQGGLDRARLALSTVGRLESVQDNLPPGVTFTEAWQLQGTDSLNSGPVEWGGHPVRIRVIAATGGIPLMVEGMFQAEEVENNYTRLITAARSFIVKRDFQGDDRDRTIDLDGKVWHSASIDTNSWTPHVYDYVRGVKRTPQPAIPEVASFVATRWPLAQELPAYMDPNSETFSLVGNETDVTYYKWPHVDAAGIFSLFYMGHLTIEVAGHVVLLFERGFKIEGSVTVQKPGGYSGQSSLVIVAPPNGVELHHPGAGVWFWGGLQSTVPLVLVSNGAVHLEQVSSYNQSWTVQNVSVFADSVHMTGPIPGKMWTLKYTPAMDATITWLSAHGALPNSIGAGNGLYTLIPGTWRESATP